MFRKYAAPACPRLGRSGALVFALCTLLSACDSTPRLRGQRELDIGSDTIRLGPGVEVHEVGVHARSGQSEFDPPSIEIRPGDVVRFDTEDSWTHALEFQAMPQSANSLFEQKGQMRSPPLLVKGASWVVSFENAPAGAYRVFCVTHQTSGTVTVKR